MTHFSYKIKLRIAKEDGTEGEKHEENRDEEKLETIDTCLYGGQSFGGPAYRVQSDGRHQYGRRCFCRHKGNDGIQAETNVIVNGGEIHITESNEGIAGRTVDILGGVTKIAASDDGLNSAAAVETEQEKAMDQDGVYTRIAGGEVHINAMADGIDSNGDLYIEGGAVYLNGPSGNGDGILDYNGKGILTGGTLFGVGGSGMMQTFDETESTQHVLVVYYTEPQNAGTIITLADENGNELGSFVAEKEHSAAIISAQEIEDGKTYHVTIGDETVNIQVEGILTIHGAASGRGMGAEGWDEMGKAAALQNLSRKRLQILTAQVCLQRDQVPGKRFDIFFQMGHYYKKLPRRLFSDIINNSLLCILIQPGKRLIHQNSAGWGEDGAQQGDTALHASAQGVDRTGDGFFRKQAAKLPVHIVRRQCFPGCHHYIF